ncbi:class I SAM-dependent methyltransferase [Adhaeretor mobilis]|uniref:Trans-aconitate 2-methyltransferase n=1 Tax=Adhaeretor mobilis TaxID=1930276 RepID=A0A517MQE8_9BACT|nr:class I SAM-dependent methyltransferase [Adhaeretor mobilis]QDS97007.1 trans-aconitate 2-methyltransferase [Adhaeretor mobilis]
MKLLADDVLERSSVVVNCCMNRERNLLGTNGYDKELRLNPMDLLKELAATHGNARWLDLCCGTGKALIQAASLVESDDLAITIVGVDLVGQFLPSESKRLQLVQASLTHWSPDENFDLITCVHGLHYIGDKLDLVLRARSWLNPHGILVANLDASNFKIEGATSPRQIVEGLRQADFEFSSQHHLLKCYGRQKQRMPFQYVGADDQAGPNYTGQAVVDSYYRCSTTQAS